MPSEIQQLIGVDYRALKDSPTAQALKDKGTPIPEIAKKLSIKTGKNAGKHPPSHPSTAPWQKPARSTPRHAPDQAPSVQDQLMGGFCAYLGCTPSESR